jgi:hypothetical protein
MVFKIGPRWQAAALKRSATDYKAYLRRLPEFIFYEKRLPPI